VSDWQSPVESGNYACHPAFSDVASGVASP